MDDHTARKLAYAQTIAAQTFVEALGMFSENLQTLTDGGAMKYREKDFIDLINRNGCSHNGVLSINWEY